MNAVVAIARADLQERTRTFGFIIVIAGFLELGYLFVPDRSAPYATVNLGGWRGVYDSAWMGVSTAVLTVSFLPLFGFFLVRPAQSRDALLGTYDQIIGAPLARAFVVLGKWSSNVVLLIAFAALLDVAAIVMQFVRAEDVRLDLAAYALPFAVVTIPACLITASFALVIAALPGLRGIGGSIVWFFIWTALIVVPMSTAGGGVAAIDPLGLSIFTGALAHGVAAAVPQANIGQAISIGIDSPANHVFRFVGVPWNPVTIATRGAWTGFAIVVAFAASPFALVGVAKPSRDRFAQLPARLADVVPLPPLVRAELAAVLASAGSLWLAGAGMLTIVAFVAPDAALARVVAPLIWVWPIGPIAFATVMDVRARCDDVLLATPTPAWRRALARTATTASLYAVPVAALALRDGPAGSVLLAVAITVAAVAGTLGAVTRSPLLFEGLALLVWYVGVVNGVPALDPASAARWPWPVAAVCAGVCIVAITLTSRVLARRA